MNSKKILLQAAVVLGTSLLSIGLEAANAVLLVGNTRVSNVVLFDEQNGSFLGEFITPGSGGLKAPDTKTEKLKGKCVIWVVPERMFEKYQY
jgi:hypothetical protein